MVHHHRREHARPSRSCDGRDQAHPLANNPFSPLWLAGELQRGSLLRRVRLKQNRPHRSGDVKDRGIHPAESGRAPAANCGDERRRHLVHRLRHRICRPVGSEDRRGLGVAVARRARLRPLRHRRHRRRHLVCRVRRPRRTCWRGSIPKVRNSSGGRYPRAAAWSATWRRRPAAGSRSRAVGSTRLRSSTSPGKRSEHADRDVRKAANC